MLFDWGIVSFGKESEVYLEKYAVLKARDVTEKTGEASFRTAVAFVSPYGKELCEMGEVQGIITEEADGDGGFGYDPVFLPDELDRTFAQCSPEEKQRISHRARALKRLIEKLGSVSS